jgi:hypothetical protein
MNRMRVRLGLLVVSALLVGPGVVHARPAVDESAATVREVKAEPSALVRAWGWLTAMFGDAGSFIDPLGGGGGGGESGHSTPVGGATTDAGSFIDPLGGGS